MFRLLAQIALYVARRIHDHLHDEWMEGGDAIGFHVKNEEDEDETNRRDAPSSNRSTHRKDAP